ncbi:MAG TPA: hypothetical protein VHN37_00705 [Actinomycetota bacterium]|nr:hypothetical protein [Actinomycetota bacterium]
MRVRSARAWLAAACALATTVAGTAVAGATTVYGSTQSSQSSGWTGEDKRVEETRAEVPEDRYAMAGGCYAIRAEDGGFVERSGEGFAATAAAAGAAEPFHFQATDLGSYLLFGSRSDFVAASEGALGEAVYGVTRSTPGATAGGLAHERTDAAADEIARSDANRAAGRGAAVVAAPEAGELADWTIAGETGSFTIVLPATEQALATDGNGALVLAETPGRFSFERRGGCAEFPELGVDVEGPILGGRTPYQEVRGFLEDHLHMMAFEFIGGRSRCGRPWHRFGVTHALVDCPDHEPGGHGAVLEAALSGGNPVEGHNTDGWPTFEGWPKPWSLTHEQVYYKWVERSWRGGLRLMVNLLVDNGQLCEIYPYRRNSCDEMENVELQARRMRELERYVDAQSGGPGEGWFRIVDDPFEAREVINDGKLAVVLGMEVSVPLGCGIVRDVPTCPADEIDERLQGVYDLGVRQMELVNKFDNAFTGVKGDSDLQGPIVNFGNFLETGSWWSMQTCSEDDGHSHDHAEAHDHTQMNFHDESGAPEEFSGRDSIFAAVISLFADTGAAPVYAPGPHCNSRGLTDMGRTAIREMVERGMIFDPDHMSSHARTDAMALVEQIGEELRASGSTVTPGVVSSHSWADDTIYRKIYELGGVVTPHAGGSTSYAAKWRKYRDWADERFLFGIGFGSDMNGFSNQGRARPDNASNPVEYPFEGFGGATIHKQVSGSRAPYDVNVDGVAHYGLYPDWIEDLRKIAGGAIVDDMLLGPEAYLQMWERAVGVPGGSCRSDVEDLTPEDFDRLRAGMSVEEVLRTLGQPRSRSGNDFAYCLAGERTGTVTFTGGGEVVRWDTGGATDVVLDAANPASGQVTDEVSLAATVTDAAGAPVAGETVRFAVGPATATATSDDGGRAVASLRLEGPPGEPGVTASLGDLSVTAPFTVAREDTILTLFDAVASGKEPAVARAALAEDGGMMAGRTISFYVAERGGGSKPRAATLLGTAVTDANGMATIEVPDRYVSGTRRTITATFDGERDFLPSSATASAYRT